MTTDLEVIRELNESVEHRDFSIVSERLHPDVVWEHNIDVGSLEEGVYRGRENVVRLLERILEPWEYLRAEQHEIRRLEDGSYHVRGDLRAKHVTSATEIVSPYEQRFEIRDGLLVKGQMRSSPLNASSGPRLAGESENATIVRRFVDAFNRADFDAALRDVDPDIELDEWPVAPGAQSYRGHEGVRRALDTWFESWEWMRVEVEGIVEVDDRLLLTLHQRARGRESAVEVEIQTFNVYTFRDRRIVRMQLFTERAPALEAAGMAHPEGSGAR